MDYMPTAEWWEFLLVILGLVLGGYLVLWSIGSVQNSVSFR